jgi:serine/threonine-protein kinase
MLHWIPMHWLRRGVAFHGLLLGSLVAALLWSPLIEAQNSAAAANALFQEAKQLGKDGDWAAACPKFKKSYELDEQLGTLLNLADCYDQLGKVATAWTRWSDALEWAKRDNDGSRIKFAEERLNETAAKLPKVTIRVTNPVATLTIKRRNVVVDSAMWGSAIPVDPGPVDVKVLRAERVLVTRRVEARIAEVTVVDIDLADIDRQFPAVAKPQPTVAPTVAPTAKPPPLPLPPREPYDPTHRNVGLAVGAVGLAGVLAAAALEIVALVKKGQAEEPDACVNKFCSQAGLDDAESAATFAEVGQWVGIGGLVVLAVGATIFFTAPSDESGSDSAYLAPLLGPDGAGLSVGGRF